MEQIKIGIAPASITADSFAVVWDRPQAAETSAYEIELNGKPYSALKHEDFTAESMSADTEYRIRVNAINKQGEICAQSEEISLRTDKATEEINVKAKGAIGDGKADDTAAIQSAIDACKKGGKVRIPEGDYLSGALFLKSDMTLQIDKGARIKGIAEAKAYPIHTYRWEGKECKCYASLINAGVGTDAPVRNVKIVGEGIIDASGEALKRSEQGEGKAERGRALCIRNAENVYIKGVTVRQSPSWCVHLICCNKVSINGVSVHTRTDEYGRRYRDIYNGDGIDPDSCKNVYIFNSTIASQDDCIAIKSGRDEEGRKAGLSSEHIRITNCRFESGFGVAIGSEMSGGVKDVLVRDCRFRNTFSIGSVKTCRGRGGVIEDVVFEDVELINTDREFSDCKWFRGGIYVDCYYSVDEVTDEKEDIWDGTPLIRNVSFKNATVDTCGGNAVYISGLPERYLENISLENIRAVGKYGMKAYYINGLKMKNVKVSAREGEAYEYRQVNEQ